MMGLARRDPSPPDVELSCALPADLVFPDGMMFGDGRGQFLMEIVEPRWWDLPRWWVWSFRAKSRVSFVDGGRRYRARRVRSTHVPKG